MATKRDIMAVGTAAPLARMLGSDSPMVVSPGGVDQNSATPLEVNFALLYGGLGAQPGGVQLPPATGQFIHVLYNADPVNAASVYPADAEQINGLLPGQGLSLPPLTCGFFLPARQQWGAVISSGGLNMDTPVTLIVPGNSVPLNLQSDAVSPVSGKIDGPYIFFGHPNEDPIFYGGLTGQETGSPTQYAFGWWAGNNGLWIDENSNAWVDQNLDVGGNLVVHGTITPPPSDARLKTDVEGYWRGLQAVMELEPVSWRWNGRGGQRDDGRRHYGFVADKVEPWIPEAVGRREVRLDPGDTEDTTILTLDPEPIIGALVNAVQQLGRQVIENTQTLQQQAARLEEVERLVLK